MKWNSRKKKLLLDSLENNTSKSRMGVSCLCVPLTKGICAKLYKNKMQRDRCAKFQKVAAKNLLAPKVGDMFALKLVVVDLCDNVGSRTMHGYLSEKVDLRGVRLSRNKVKKLENELLDIGIWHYDIRKANVGYLDGNLVCIDFDTNSCKKKIKKGQLNHFNEQT